VAYTDTSVIVAALDPGDPRCRKARRLLEDGGYRVVSELTLVELASAITRRGELLSSLASAIGADEELALSAALLYLLKRFGLRYRPVEHRSGFIACGRAGVVAATALSLANSLKLRALDLLHAAYAKLLKEQGEPISAIETADREFWERREEIKEALGLRVVLIE